MGLIKIISEENLINLDNEFYSNECGIITLIVGWELAKTMGANILHHKIDETTYWTFSPREKRKIYEEDLKKYKNVVLDHLKLNKIIINVNPLNFLNSEQLLNYVLNNFSELNGYLYKGSLYIYNDNKIYHIDIDLLSFMSWDIIDEIRGVINLKTIDNKFLKYLEYLDFKYIPYLIDAKENNIISDIRR
jgi:hypothetical protein